MNKEEIQEALKIIREPITVNSIEYKYFTQENYEKLLRVYEICQQFVDFYEHFEQHLEILQQENQQLKKQKDEIKKYIKSFEYYIPKEHKTELLRMLGEIE
jgi:predicted ribosome quality control (RQC) complex YloA/Tae2 family protein